MINPVCDREGTQRGWALFVHPRAVEALPGALLAAASSIGAIEFPKARNSTAIITTCELIGSSDPARMEIWATAFRAAFDPPFTASRYPVLEVCDTEGQLQGWSIPYPAAQLGQLGPAIKTAYAQLDEFDGSDTMPIVHAEVSLETLEEAEADIEDWASPFYCALTEVSHPRSEA